MRFNRLVRRTLFYHRRGNFAVMLGVAVGTAVLTGALLVGDSLRGSLTARVMNQIGWVDFAMVSNRYISEDTVRGMNPPSTFAKTILSIDRNTGDVVAAPGVIVYASAESADWRIGEAPRRVRNVVVLAMPLPAARTFYMPVWPSNWEMRMRYWFPKLFSSPSYMEDRFGMFQATNKIAFVSHGLGREVGARTGDHVTLRFAKAGAVPNESFLGRRSQTNGIEKTVMVRVFEPETLLSQFSITPSVQEPLNAVIEYSLLQELVGEPGRCNLVLACGGDAGEWTKKLHDNLTLDDWGLKWEPPKAIAESLFQELDHDRDKRLSRNEYSPHIASLVAESVDGNKDQYLSREEIESYHGRRGFLSLESRQLLIEPAVERAALQTAKELNVPIAPTLVYLANSISDGKNEIPYSVIAALDPSLSPPLGPFLPAGQPPLGDDEILLADWPESPLRVKPGDPITVRYFLPESHGRYDEATKTFKLRALIPMTGVAADPDLTPEFPGITDKLGLKDWNPPFPYDSSKITQRDEDFWKKYRATPKAYVTLAAGQKHFGSRFGNLTSIRIAPAPGMSLDTLAEQFKTRLLANLKPEDGGFVFEDLRERARQASEGATNFGGLFLGFSCFLIAAAVLLVGLLVRLNLERRAAEIGLLFAAGFSVRRVRRLYLTEGLIVAVVGGMFGLLGAIGYAALMLKLLAAVWPDESVGSFLSLHVTWVSLAYGFVGSVVICGVTVFWAVNALKRYSPSTLLAGSTAAEVATATVPKKWNRWAIVICAGLAVVLSGAGWFIRDHEAQAGSFFGSGALFLIAGLLAVRQYLRRDKRSAEVLTVTGLALRNAARHPTRSLLTAGLFAAAAFLLVAVESFRRDPATDFLSRTGGSGGFALIADSDVPIFQDLNDPETGRKEILESLERRYQQQPGDRKTRLASDRAVLEATQVIPLRLRSGDDAGCRNLFQPGKPRLLGVPPQLVDRGGFHFAATEAKTSDDRDNPWRLLAWETDDGSIPVFGEANTVRWMLKKGLGDRIEVNDEAGRPVNLVIVGLLQDSVFQGELLIAEHRFLRLYPRHEGFQFFLIESPKEETEHVRGLLETALADRGFVVTSAADRLRSYLAVENTYLTTFQVLGSFGLLLGVGGLAVVLLRGVWERRGEIALLRAVGYRHAAVRRLVLTENLFLLLLGLAAGVGSAALAVLPHRFQYTTAVPLGRLALLLVGVLIVGLLAARLAVRGVMRLPVLAALRRE